MSDLETALRNALVKGDASNPEFRQRVYRAAIDALQRTLAAQGAAEPEKAADQKRRLADAIRAAEAYYQQQPAAGPEPGASPDVRPEPRMAGRGPAAPEVAGLRAAPRRHGGDEAPSVDRGERMSAPASGEGKAKRRRAPFAILLSVAVVIALLGIGAWWVISTGAFKSAAERDTSVPNPPLRLDNESFESARDSDTALAPAGTSRDEGWVTLFQPSDPTTVSLEGGASATIESDPFGEYARIVSPNATSSIAIDIPPGTLQMLAGKTVQFSIIARSDDNAPTQMSVTCDFGGAGDCGRRRFSVKQTDNEFLFRVDLPPEAGSAGGGRLSIVTNIANQGRAVKLSGVRLRELPSGS